MISRLKLTRSIRETLFGHARDGMPNGADDTPREVCGVLGGRRQPLSPSEIDAAADPGAGVAERAIVTDCRRVPNVADRPRTRYELDPAATVDAIGAVESDGLEHLGFYHSHPHGPRGPSRTDRARATWPGYVYAIVSLTDEPVIGAWRWTGDAFVQLPIDVEPL